MIMVLGTIYVVFFADDFIGPFQGFLITSACRSRPGPASSSPTSLLRQRRLRRRRALRPARPLRRGALAGASCWSCVGTFLGWGLVTNGLADWLTWQGYLLEPFGLGGKDGAWAFANLGVLRRVRGRAARHAADRARPGPRPGGDPGRPGRLRITGARRDDDRRPPPAAYGRTTVRIAPASRSAAPGAEDSHSDGSVSSSSITTGSPASSGSRSTRA